MFKFGPKSLKTLETCDERLQKIANRAIMVSRVDFGIVCGFRGEDVQNNLFKTGASKVKYPESKHNHEPSLAIDIAVWNAEKNEYDWDNEEYYYYLAGIFESIAAGEGVNLRVGLNWDSDNNFFDQKFYDLGHYEINE